MDSLKLYNLSLALVLVVLAVLLYKALDPGRNLGRHYAPAHIWEDGE